MKILNIVVLFLVFLGGSKLFDYQYNRIERFAERRVNGYTSMTELESELECLTQNLYFEAGVESIEGKLAVAQVTMNRVKSPLYPNTVCGVVHDKSQFSWTLDTPQNRHNFKNRNPQKYAECYEIAKKVLIEKFTVPSLGNVLYYHATYVSPSWASTKKFVVKIGGHKFYE